jgi:hypothetical protein
MSKSPRNTAAPERASANFRSVTAASVPLLWKQTSGQSSCKANQAHRSAACRHPAPPQRGGMVPRTGQPCAQPCLHAVLCDARGRFGWRHCREGIFVAIGTRGVHGCRPSDSGRGGRALQERKRAVARLACEP